MLQKKNAYSLSNTSRSLKTNQVSGEDRIARISNMESSALKAIGSDSILKELMGPRSDSSDAKNEMFKQISMYGYVRQRDLPDDLDKKQTLLTTYSFLLGAGIDSDLMEDDRPISNIDLSNLAQSNSINNLDDIILNSVY